MSQPPSHRVERVVTSGVFSLDGADFDVENNVWLWSATPDSPIVVIDAAHSAPAIAAALAGRPVEAIVCTHGHNDHINAAVELARLVDAPILLHPDDRMLWDMHYPEHAPDDQLSDGMTISGLKVVHTPGHSPGGVCLVADGVLFSGDTLFHGGPGATGRSFSDFSTIIRSISTHLLPLPAETVVHTGHGSDTSIGAEAPDLDLWVARGH